MKVILIPVFVLAAVLAAGCASNSGQAEWRLPAQEAESAEDHEQFAQHYDQVAKTLEADAAEERAVLTDYQRRPHRYGRRIKDLKAQSMRLLRDYEKSAKDAREMAEFHRQMAAEMR